MATTAVLPTDWSELETVPIAFNLNGEYATPEEVSPDDLDLANTILGEADDGNLSLDDPTLTPYVRMLLEAGLKLKAKRNSECADHHWFKLCQSEHLTHKVGYCGLRFCCTCAERLMKEWMERHEGELNMQSLLEGYFCYMELRTPLPVPAAELTPAVLSEAMTSVGRELHTVLPSSRFARIRHAGYLVDSNTGAATLVTYVVADNGGDTSPVLIEQQWRRRLSKSNLRNFTSARFDGSYPSKPGNEYMRVVKTKFLKPFVPHDVRVRAQHEILLNGIPLMRGWGNLGRQILASISPEKAEKLSVIQHQDGTTDKLSDDSPPGPHQHHGHDRCPVCGEKFVKVASYHVSDGPLVVKNLQWRDIPPDSRGPGG